MKSSIFPIGYIQCLSCGRPALWLMECINYNGMLDTNNALVGYELANINYIGYDPDISGIYFCDSCHKELEEDNLSGKYIIFLDNIDNVEEVVVN